MPKRIKKGTYWHAEQAAHRVSSTCLIDMCKLFCGRRAIPFPLLPFQLHIPKRRIRFSMHFVHFIHTYSNVCGRECGACILCDRHTHNIRQRDMCMCMYCHIIVDIELTVSTRMAMETVLVSRVLAAHCDSVCSITMSCIFEKPFSTFARRT